LPSSSSSSQAAVRKAQKLSSFFGTTKGEVWKRLLDDIAGAVAEDEELEDEERREVLESLEKLREGAQHEQHQQLTVHA
jgi:nitrogenase molybdenum-iron protein alpha/beta subunit